MTTVAIFAVVAGILLAFAAAVVGVVWVLVRSLMWLILLPFKLLFALIAVPFLLLKFILLAIGGVVGVTLAVAGGLLMLFAIVLPLVPLLALGALIWAIATAGQRPAAA